MKIFEEDPAVKRPDIQTVLKILQERAGVNVKDPTVQRITKLCEDAGFSAYFFRQVSPGAIMGARLSVGLTRETVLLDVPRKNFTVAIVLSDINDVYSGQKELKRIGMLPSDKNPVCEFLRQSISRIPIDHIVVYDSRGKSVASTGSVT